MWFVVLQSYLRLIQFDLYLARGDFARLHHKVRTFPIHEKPQAGGRSAQISAAVDLACVFYWKQVQCLQRSAATTCLLRQYGIPAQLVIGARFIPFKAHAWTEVEGQVVNDKPYIPDIYQVLERC
jgi:hypothetical protein